MWVNKIYGNVIVYVEKKSGSVKKVILCKLDRKVMFIDFNIFVFIDILDNFNI